MTEEQVKLYKQLQQAIHREGDIHTYIHYCQMIIKQDYMGSYRLLSKALEEITASADRIQQVISLMKMIEKTGEPLPTLQMNKAVSCSYTEPDDQVHCSSCSHACRMTCNDSDDEYILCNICSQAVKAYKRGYCNSAIIDAYGVHPDGQCKFYQVGEEPPMIDDLLVEEEEEIEIPPEAEGSVDPEDMEGTKDLINPQDMI